MNFLFKLFRFIFYIVLLINSTLCYDPAQRVYHNSVIINDRLLILGGTKINEIQSSELFYLDLSQSFDNKNLSWNLIREGDLPIYTYSSTSIVSLDNSTIFLIGGFMVNKDTLVYDSSNLVYTYNYFTSEWTTPSITGDDVSFRQQITGVIDDSGTIYIFGGIGNTLTERNSNEMNTLDTSKMAWKILTITNNLPPVSNDYSASILSNGIIVYFGGQSNGTLLKMKNIKLYDTKKDEWSHMVATGIDVDSRFLFASVLTPDGYIIIFGGCTVNLTSVSPNLAMLDTNKSPYEWSIPSSSKVNSLPSIYGHAANLYYNYAIITFGYNLENRIYNSKVYLYDITNNTLVTQFNPPLSFSPSPNPILNSTSTPSPDSPKFLKPLLIGLGTGIGVIILICIGIFIYLKKFKKVESPVLKIAGNN
ncbi:hypothetical protein Glove_421g66 [Diversispora epigaea]|uniref:Galactose oxidase n=1 Tax=Diversispora epigaea TaxID=1348612 RepID=A0A397GV82_9GLOM|nr:hypothetical protein Glove_421g66 [Diversispora epigaea]